MRLLLARHGQTEWNAGRRFQGATDVGLSERGRAQAAALARALADRPLAAVYVSPMRRAMETAEIALADRDIPVVPVAGLRELSLGEWEGSTVDEIRSQEGDPYLAWLRAPHDCPPPGGEPLDAVCARVRTAIDAIALSHADRDDVLVVAHGGIISVYACHLLGTSFNSLWRLRVDNCSLTVVRPPRLVSINDVFHLEGVGHPLQTSPSTRDATVDPRPGSGESMSPNAASRPGASDAAIAERPGPAGARSAGGLGGPSRPPNSK